MFVEDFFAAKLYMYRQIQNRYIVFQRLREDKPRKPQGWSAYSEHSIYDNHYYMTLYNSF